MKGILDNTTKPENALISALQSLPGPCIFRFKFYISGEENCISCYQSVATCYISSSFTYRTFFVNERGSLGRLRPNHALNLSPTGT